MCFKFAVFINQVYCSLRTSKKFKFYSSSNNSYFQLYKDYRCLWYSRSEKNELIKLIKGISRYIRYHFQRPGFTANHTINIDAENRIATKIAKKKRKSQSLSTSFRLQPWSRRVWYDRDRTARRSSSDRQLRVVSRRSRGSSRRNSFKKH